MEASVGFFPAVFSRQEGAANFEGLKKTYFFATKVTTCIASFVGFGLIAWGKPFIRAWMGPEYVDAYPVLVVLTAGMIVALSQATSPSCSSALPSINTQLSLTPSRPLPTWS